jgi:hypothetical protein
VIDHIIEHRINKQKTLLLPKIEGNYISNSGNINIKLNKQNQLILSGVINSGPEGNNISETQEELIYVGNNRFYSEKNTIMYHFNQQGITGIKSFTRDYDDYTWFFNDGFNGTANGMTNSNLNTYTGKYNLYGYGPVAQFTVHLQQGTLFMDSIRLIQKESNIFITPVGQVLVFDKMKLNWAGLTLTKQ